MNCPVNIAIVTGLKGGLYEENDETWSPAIDKDWQIFNNSTEALPIIDSDFFEDADACVRSPATSNTAPARVTGEQEIFLEESSYNDTAHLDLTDIYEALDDFETRSQADYVPAEYRQSMEQERMLEQWFFDYQRHEWVALKLQQPSYITVPQIDSYGLPYTTERQ